MKQVLQSLRTGTIEVADVPRPSAGRGQVLIATSRTLISAGTERMLVEFGQANLLDKARLQPDKVRIVLDKVRTDGLLPTVASVRNKLDQPLALGYCAVGTVVEVGAGVHAFGVGDRVASNGKHAEFVCLPETMCARVPENVPDDLASFTVPSAIALQGIRLVHPTLGEAVVVTGLGLIGLLTVQLLRAQGCRVLGLDFDPAKLELARRYGAETLDLSTNGDALAAAMVFSRGRGVDAVLITASTKSSEPIHQAALMCRQRGRIVLVGVAGLDLSRGDFYKKELTFQVSSSYGPGRYDPSYEERGHDYPVGFVRWTAQRNFEAVLDMLADCRLDPAPMISHRFPIADAAAAYELLSGASPSLGIVLSYPTAALESVPRTVARTAAPTAANGPRLLTGASPSVSFVGAGNYSCAVLIPAFKAAGARLETVASSGGVSGLHASRRFGFARTTTDTDSLFADTATDIVVITTRHDSHALFVARALSAGKHVFVEKPLCLTLDELAEIETAVARSAASGAAPQLMVGFNRRFAPHVRRVHQLLRGVTEPKAFVMTVNAGAIPSDHWTQDPASGGGRIVGEGCHFIDLLRFLAGSRITSHALATLPGAMPDTATLQLGFADGSIGTVHYLANGSKSFPKERLEVFAGGRVLQLDNFRKLTGFGWPHFSSMNLWRQDKGQRACAAAFVDSVRMRQPSPIPFSELAEVARVTIEAVAGRTSR